MKAIMKNLKKLLQTFRRQNLKLKQRMLIYLIVMILASLGLVMLFSILGGIVWNDKKHLSQILEKQLIQVDQKLEAELDRCAGYSYNLAKQLSRTIEYQMADGHQEISVFHDSPEKLVELQRRMYGDLNTALLMGDGTGVYAVLNATVNSSLEGAEHSRSGLYLRVVSINGNLTLMPETSMFRGSPEVAWEKGLELHNRWNLEFDIDLIPFFREIMSGEYELSDGFWTDRLQLKDTWENAILLCVPIRGSGEKIYGLCGMELNAMHFNTEYAIGESDYGSIVTVVAPLDGGKLRLDQGMIGSPEGTWLTGMEILDYQPGKNLMTYRSDSGDFFGMQKKLNIHGVEGKEWVAAVLVPKERSMQHIRKNFLIRIVVVGIFAICMILLAVYLSDKFVRPILESFEDIKGERKEGSSEVRIAELEELKEFIESKNQKLRIKKLPENIEEMLTSFQKRAESLTPTERLLLKYYTKDYSLEEIAEKMFISIGTAKKHNTNMNRKLEISSRSQLMVYIELFRRCSRLEDVIGEDEEGESPL